MRNSISTGQKISAVAFAFFVITVLIVFTFDYSSMWGIAGLYLLPNVWLFCIAVVCILMTIFGDKIISAVLKALDNSSALTNKIITAFFLITAVHVFWLFRSKNLILGDGLWLIDHIHEGNYEFSAGTIVIVIHIWTAKLLSYFADSPALLSYRLISILSGVVYLYGSFLCSKALFESKQARLFGFVSFLTPGIIQLFFGYVENYALPIALTPFLFYSVINYIQGKSSVFFVLSLFLIICALHLAAISIGPALLYLLYVKSPKNVFYRYRKSATAGIIVLAGIAGVFLLTKFEGRVFVNLIKSELFTYTPGSFQFWADLLNRLILTSIFSVFLLLIALFFGKVNNAGKESYSFIVTFALIAALSTFLFCSLIEPKLGAFRDWDLQSFYAIPLHTLGLAMIGYRRPGIATFNKLTAIALSFCLLFTIPWINYNYSPIEKTLGISSKIIEHDVHFTVEYDMGKRMKSWAVILNDEKTGGYAEAEKVLENYLHANPDDVSAIHMLAYSAMRQKKYNEAYQLSQIVLSTNPQDPRYILQTAQLAVGAGKNRYALELLDGLHESNQELPVVVGVKAQAHYELGNNEIAASLFYKSMLTGNKDVDFLYKYSEFLEDQNLFDSSRVVLNQVGIIESRKREFN